MSTNDRMKTPDHSSRLAQTPSSSSSRNSSSRRSTPPSISSQSVLHSGHSVTNVVNFGVPEKNSPIQATPQGFKRVRITPQRMDVAFSAASTEDLDSRLRTIAQQTKKQAPSPEERKEFMSAVANMFDDEDNSVQPAEESRLARSAGSAAATSVQDRLPSNLPPPSDDFDALFDESSFLDRDVDALTRSAEELHMSNNPQTNGTHGTAAGGDSTWMSLLATAASVLEPAPVGDAPASQKVATASAASSVTALPATGSAQLRPKLTQPVPELDPSLEPFLATLISLDREFFKPTSNEDARRLWQKYMLLPVDQLLETVLQQHEMFVQAGLFADLTANMEV